MKFGLSIIHSMVHVIWSLPDLLTLFGWEDMINFVENLVAKVLGMAFGQFC